MAEFPQGDVPSVQRLNCETSVSQFPIGSVDPVFSLAFVLKSVDRGKEPPSALAPVAAANSPRVSFGLIEGIESGHPLFPGKRREVFLHAVTVINDHFDACCWLRCWVVFRGCGETKSSQQENGHQGPQWQSATRPGASWKSDMAMFEFHEEFP